MESLKIKNILFVLLITYLFFVALIVSNIYPNSAGLGRVNILDYSFLIALRYSIPLIVFLIPIRKLIIKLGLYTVALFLLGYVIPLIPLADTGSIVYLIFYFPIGLIAGTLIYFVSTSRFTQSSTVVVSIFIMGIIACIGLSYLSINLTKATAEEYAKFYAYDYLRCNGNSVSPDNFQNICDNLTGNFFQPYYQNICFAQVESLKTTKSMTKDFQACYTFDSFKGSKHKFSNYFMNYWGLKSAIGLPNSS